MDMDGRSIQANDEITPIMLRAAAHPLSTRDAVRKGGF